MKAQRRQELRANELVETLRQAREFLEKYGTYVAGVVVVVVVVAGAFLWHRNSELAEHRRQWEDYYNLERDAVQFVVASIQGTEVAGSDDLESLVSRYKARASAASDPRVRLLLLEGLGDFCWAYCVNALDEGSDAAVRARALKEANSAFEQITREFADDEWSVGKALMAQAVIAEEQGDFDRAEELYRRILSDLESEATSLGELAEEALVRVDDLREPIVFAPAPPPPEEPQEPAVFGPQLEPEVATQEVQAKAAPVIRRLGEDEEGPSSPAEPSMEGPAAGGSTDEQEGAEEEAISPSAPGEAVPAKATAAEDADEPEAVEEGPSGTTSE
jgi:hypothetical protein